MLDIAFHGIVVSLFLTFVFPICCGCFCVVFCRSFLLWLLFFLILSVPGGVVHVVFNTVGSCWSCFCDC